LIHWPTGATLGQIGGHDDVVYSASWSATQRRLALGSMDTRVTIVTLPEQDTAEPRTGSSQPTPSPLQMEHRSIAKGHSKGVLAVGFLNDNQLLTAGMDQTIRLWSLSGTQAQPERTFENHTDTVRGLIRRPAESEALCMIASIGADRTVRFWQPTIGRMVRFARLNEAAPLAAAWLPDGQLLVVACDDGHVRTIDPDTAELTSDVAVQTGWCYALAVHPQTGAVVVGGTEGVSRLRDKQQK
jgi:WD40 repeat protein